MNTQEERTTQSVPFQSLMETQFPGDSDCFICKGTGWYFTWTGDDDTIREPCYICLDK